MNIHSGGCNCMFADGHAKWIMEDDSKFVVTQAEYAAGTWVNLPYWNPWAPANQ
jgi:prepilin-type processing-associated H-X9-DG protein